MELIENSTRCKIVDSEQRYFSIYHLLLIDNVFIFNANFRAPYLKWLPLPKLEMISLMCVFICFIDKLLFFPSVFSVSMWFCLTFRVYALYMWYMSVSMCPNHVVDPYDTFLLLSCLKYYISFQSWNSMCCESDPDTFSYLMVHRTTIKMSYGWILLCFYCVDWFHFACR